MTRTQLYTILTRRKAHKPGSLNPITLNPDSLVPVVMA